MTAMYDLRALATSTIEPCFGLQEIGKMESFVLCVGQKSTFDQPSFSISQSMISSLNIVILEFNFEHTFQSPTCSVMSFAVATLLFGSIRPTICEVWPRFDPSICSAMIRRIIYVRPWYWYDRPYAQPLSGQASTCHCQPWYDQPVCPAMIRPTICPWCSVMIWPTILADHVSTDNKISCLAMIQSIIYSAVIRLADQMTNRWTW